MFSKKSGWEATEHTQHTFVIFGLIGVFLKTALAKSRCVFWMTWFDTWNPVKETESLQRICIIPMCCSQGRSSSSCSDLFPLVLYVFVASSCSTCVKGKLPGRNLRLDLLREKSLPEPLKPAIDQPVWATLCRQVKTSTKGKNASMQHQELQSVGFASKRLNYLRLTVTGNLPMESIDSHDRAQRLLRPGIL